METRDRWAGKKAKWREKTKPRTFEIPKVEADKLAAIREWYGVRHDTQALIALINRATEQIEEIHLRQPSAGE